MADLEDLQRQTDFTVAGRGGERRVTFLPEPPRQKRRWPIISVDDHIVEPPHTFEGRFPKALADQAPRVIESEDGGDAPDAASTEPQGEEPEAEAGDTDTGEGA